MLKFKKTFVCDNGHINCCYYKLANNSYKLEKIGWEKEECKCPSYGIAQKYTQIGQTEVVLEEKSMYTLWSNIKVLTNGELLYSPKISDKRTLYSSNICNLKTNK